MQAEDIIWGGNNKCEIKLRRDIGVIAGDVIDLVYNYMSDTYEAKKDSETSSIVVNQVNRRTLDNIYLSGNSPATIVRVIDADDQNLIVEVKVFRIRLTLMLCRESKLRPEKKSLERCG